MTARAEYQRGIMDASSDPEVHTVVVMTSAQVGKTEIINNTVGYYVDQDPAPIMVLQPTLEMGEAWSKDRLSPMIRDMPELSAKFGKAASRISGNTIKHKSFPGGHITISGANSPASLASRPIRILLGDEVDRYKASAGPEGDPITLAQKRTNNFWNRKRIYVSTPTVKNVSRIEKLYNESDQRRWYVPCPHCEHTQTLVWAQVRWPEGHPEKAEYACEECGALWNDAERYTAVSKGEWRAGSESAGIAGFHLNELYSPWRLLAETVADFLAAKDFTEMLQAWTNTALGETWEEKGDKLDSDGLRRLSSVYTPKGLPEDVLFVTAGVDTQGDRLEVEFVGWGENEQTWGVEYLVIHGDPAQPTVWEELDARLKRSYLTESGREVLIKGCSIDSGGHHAEAVLRFAADRFNRGVRAIKGMPGQGKPIWPIRASKTKYANYQVFMVGVDTAKDTIYARLQIEEPGPGFCNIPAAPDLGYDEKWMLGVTSEQRVTRYRQGRPYTVWDCPKGVRNEPLDCRVYAIAAMKALGKRVWNEAALINATRKAPAPKKSSWLGSDNWLGTQNKDWLK